jgi:ribose 1,5-bisphosphokinase PhnN
MDRLTQILEGFRCCRRGERPFPFHRSSVTAIAIVGSTCSGKTTIADAIRSSPLTTAGVVVPRRFVTRPARVNDNFVENTCVTSTDFAQLVAAGSIELRWRRRMEGVRAEEYGFEPVPRGQFAVFSGNNALFDNASTILPESYLDGALYLGVYAPDATRTARLSRRSPDLIVDHPDEVAYRLADSSENVYRHSHICLDNYGANEAQAPAEAIRLIGDILRYVASTR